MLSAPGWPALGIWEHEDTTTSFPSSFTFLFSLSSLNDEELAQKDKAGPQAP